MPLFHFNILRFALFQTFKLVSYLCILHTLSSILEFLGETRIIIIIIIIIQQIIMISAGTPLVSNSFHFSWNPKYIEFWDQYIFGFQLKLKE